MKRILIVSVLCVVAYLVGHPSVMTTNFDTLTSKLEERNEAIVKTAHIQQLLAETERLRADVIASELKLRALRKTIETTKQPTEVLSKDEKALKATLEDSK